MTMIRRRALALLGWATLVATVGLGVAQPAQAYTPVTLLSSITTDTQQLYGQWSNAAVSPDGTIQAVSAEYFGPINTGSVTLVNQTTHTATQVLDPGTDITTPMGIAFNSDGSLLYVANHATDQISIIDVANAIVIDAITDPNARPMTVAVSPDGSTLVAFDDDDHVVGFDITNNYNVLYNVSGISTYVQRIAFDGSSAYLIDYYGTITVINWSTGEILSTYATEAGVGQYGAGCVSLDLSTLVFPDSDNVVIADLASGATRFDIDVQSAGITSAAQCVVTPDGQKALVTDWYDSNPGKLAVIDIPTGTIDEIVELTDVDQPTGISIMAGCQVFADGFNTNIAVLQLDEAWCIDPNAPTGGSSLADTGASQTLIITLASVGGCLVVLGVVAMLVVRRRHQTY